MTGVLAGYPLLHLNLLMNRAVRFGLCKPWIPAGDFDGGCRFGSEIIQQFCRSSSVNSIGETQ
ncbi:MAG: hypothetical protein DSY87_08355 [Methylococcus sp.]|nr:MAG: hypothetical protein DSY87_08355 [Methylococcus sp.]